MGTDLTSEQIIYFHTSFAMFALLLGPIVIYRKKRDWLHKYLGYFWVGVIFLTATSSLFISSFPIIGPFSPIHLLVCLALYGIFDGALQAIGKNIALHERIMKSIYWNGVLIAGLFNFLPNRMVSKALFGSNEQIGLYIVVGMAFLLARLFYLRGKRSTA